MKSFNVLGTIAVVNFPFETKLKDKKIFANELLKEHNNIKTVVEKSGIFKGRLRKMQTKHLAGEKNKEVLYKENGCVFRFNIDSTYFSPRLSNERKEIASKIKKKDNVLVMFAGVGPFSITIAKNCKCKIVSNELNREANKYGELNIDLNKVKDYVELMPGDVKRVTSKLNEKKRKFGVIVMPRPRLKDSFLKEAFSLSKKGTRIFYYDFCKVEDSPKIIEMIKDQAKESKKKIKIIGSKSAGEIAPYKIRLRVDLKVL